MSSRRAARRLWRECQNGARAQGCAAPRQNRARPCALRAVPAENRIATGGSGGMTFRTRNDSAPAVESRIDEMNWKGRIYEVGDWKVLPMSPD